MQIVQVEHSRYVLEHRPSAAALHTAGPEAGNNNRLAAVASVVVDMVAVDNILDQQQAVKVPVCEPVLQERELLLSPVLLAQMSH
ncbi:hypothetical protein D3C78_1514850 [compost metagenome]